MLHYVILPITLHYLLRYINHARNLMVTLKSRSGLENIQVLQVALFDLGPLMST
jgi:hypothetical protein